MADEITLQQYLAREELQLAVWGGKECLRLELLMDYSGPFKHPGAPDVLGVAAIRWSVLSDECGNGISLRTQDDLHFVQAILVAFLYAKIVALDLKNRTELFQRVQNAVKVCLASDDWSSLAFAPWYLDGPGFQQMVWPWEIAEWSEVEARRSGALVQIAGTAKSMMMMKTYVATLLTGPRTSYAPHGWWLRFHQPDPELAGVLLPATPLIAITNFSNEAQGDSRSLVPALVRRINLYYESPERIPFAADAMAVRAAMQTVLRPGEGDIVDYRRQDDAARRQDQRTAEAQAASASSPIDWIAVEKRLADGLGSIFDWFRRK